MHELQRVYEIILHRKLDKRNFRKKILSTGIWKIQVQRKWKVPIVLPDSIVLILPLNANYSIMF